MLQAHGWTEIPFPRTDCRRVDSCSSAIPVPAGQADFAYEGTAVPLLKKGLRSCSAFSLCSERHGGYDKLYILLLWNLWCR